MSLIPLLRKLVFSYSKSLSFTVGIWTRFTVLMKVGYIVVEALRPVKVSTYLPLDVTL